MKKNKAIFLDRDGVINKEVNYLYKIEDFQFTKNCIQALRKLELHGYLLFIITNQAGIGRGYYSEEEYNYLNSWMLEELKKKKIKITEVKFCPHHKEYGIGKYKLDCECRKPKIGMIKPLIKKYNIDIENSILIGDKMSDINLGVAAQIGTLILVKSGHKLPDVIPKSVNYVYENLDEFADHITH